MDGCGLGLGYHATSSNNHAPAGEQKSLPPAGAAVDNINDYMNQYLQQCLQYHEEQERHRQEQQQEPSSALASVTKTEALPEFVSGGVFSVKVEDSADPADSASSAPATPSTTAEMAAEGRRKAQLILQRFQQQQEQLLYKREEEEPLQALSPQPPLPAAPFYPPEPPEASVFLEQRRRGMQREIRIKKQALLKNLEFVEQKERQRSEQLQSQIEHARKLEEHAKAQYQAATLRRTQQQQKDGELVTQAGIGTKKRKKVERIKEKAGHKPQGRPTTVALYISGMPTDGSVTREYVGDLFGSFGAVEKVHFYQNKKSGALKGDGLVVYDLAQADRAVQRDPDQLMQMVCSQMNGAELSGGFQLSVEPSTSHKKSCLLPAAVKGKEKSPAEREGLGPGEVETGGCGDNDEELEDFFASL